MSLFGKKDDPAKRYASRIVEGVGVGVKDDAVPSEDAMEVELCVWLLVRVIRRMPRARRIELGFEPRIAEEGGVYEFASSLSSTIKTAADLLGLCDIYFKEVVDDIVVHEVNENYDLDDDEEYSDASVLIKWVEKTRLGEDEAVALEEIADHLAHQRLNMEANRP